MSASLFIDNKYTRVYYTIVERAKSRSLPDEVYTECHHIIPQSFYRARNKTGWLSGDHNAKKNLVTLTAKEHYICHLLLTKITEGEAYFKMVHAFMRLANGRNTKQYVSAKRYATAKQLLSEARTGRPCLPETREKIRQGNLNRAPALAETRRKLSEAAGRRKGFTPEGRARVIAANTGRIQTEETKQKLREARVRQVEQQGDTMTAEARAKLSLAAKGRVFTEEHRNKISTAHKGKKISEKTRQKMKGKTFSEETRQKLREACRAKASTEPKLQVTCPHCGKTGGGPSMKRWHMDNCRNK